MEIPICDGSSEGAILLKASKNTLLGIGANGRALTEEIAAAEKETHERRGSADIFRMRFGGDGETRVAPDVRGILQQLVVQKNRQTRLLQDIGMDRAVSSLVKDSNLGFVDQGGIDIHAGGCVELIHSDIVSVGVDHGECL